MSTRSENAEVVLALLATPPRPPRDGASFRARPRPHGHGSGLARRWALGLGASGLGAVLAGLSGDALLSLAYTHIGDAFTATLGVPGGSFEDDEGVATALRTVWAWRVGLGAAEHHARGLRTLHAALEGRPSGTWSASEVAGVCARAVDQAGPESVRPLAESAWCLWWALGRDDRIEGFSGWLHALVAKDGLRLAE